MTDTRRVIAVNSNALKKAMSRLGSGGRNLKASSGTSSGTSRMSVTNCLERRVGAADSGLVGDSRRLGCLILPARASQDSGSPHSAINLQADFRHLPDRP